MAIQKQLYTSAEFLDFVNQMNNVDQIFELVEGEIVEVTPSYPFTSAIAARIVYFFMAYLMENPIGYITEGQGGYDISDENTFAPDVAFISKARQPELPNDRFNPIPPDLAVEIVSPSDLRNRHERIDKKIEHYLAAGVLLWYVFPEQREVKVYVPGQPVQVADIDGVLTGGDVLPGFTLPVRSIFPN